MWLAFLSHHALKKKTSLLAFIGFRKKISLTFFFSTETCLDPVCGEKPCQIYEVCGMDVFGEPVCQCPEGRNGPQCQNVIPLCSGSMCPIGKSLCCKSIKPLKNSEIL